MWAEGIRGEGINIALVDDGMDFNHEDLRDNVNTSLNHDYTDIGSIFNSFAHHGTWMAGIIAARDNGVGVRGVAPRATIYGYNYLLGQTFLNEASAMTRNMGVTAVSNNSWGPVGGPGLGHANALWELAVESRGQQRLRWPWDLLCLCRRQRTLQKGATQTLTNMQATMP